jgi:16S rRNA (cytosine1402-N4)-methyltransferase
MMTQNASKRMHQNQNKKGNEDGKNGPGPQTTNQQHLPVMLAEVLNILDPKPGQSYLDLTAGYGGHAEAVLDRTFQGHIKKAVLVDRDESAVDYLKDKFQARDVQIINKDFLSVSQELLSEGRRFDLLLADLGVSSPHLNQASRGFSFNQEAPLDMRMDRRQELTAKEIVNNYSQEELEAILREYGEEPKARSISQVLVENRPIETTTQLANLVARKARYGGRPGQNRTNPATRTFQALRIAVNDELGLLKQALPLWMELLAPEGRLAIITFHSLEDRIVKEYFHEVAGDRYDATAISLTRKPVSPGPTELVSNPRARSAKLRAVAKIKT